VANNYYARSKTFTAGTKAKGSDVVSELDSVLAGFDKLPTPAQLDSGNSNFVTAGGTANALTITSPNNVITTYTGADGLAYSVKAAATSIAGAITIDVDGVGAVPLVTDAGEVPSLGSLTINGIYLFVYNETVGKFIFSDYKSSVLSAAAAAASAGAAATSETNAATSETNAAASYDNFDDRWLGDKTADPTLDNDGNALLTGAAYFNTVIDKLKLYDGAAWTTIQDGLSDVVLDTTPQLGGDLDLNGHEITGLSGDGEKSFVASGAIPALGVVALQDDGTVIVVEDTTSLGSEHVFESADVSFLASTYIAVTDKIVIAYKDSGNLSYGTAVVGEVSGTTITFGTPVVFNSANTSYISISSDPASGTVLIAYVDQGGSTYTEVIAASISGTAITYGTAIAIEGVTAIYTASAYNPNDGKHVVAYADTTNIRGRVAGVTVTGKVAVADTAGTFEAGSTGRISMAYDPLSKRTVIAYTDSGNLAYGTANSCDTSAAVTTVGSAAVFNTASTGWPAIAHDTNAGQMVIAYQDNGNSGYGTAILAKLNGTTLSFSSSVVFNSATTTYTSAVFDPKSNKVVIAYTDGGNSSYGTAILASTAGAVLSFGSPFVFSAASTQYSRPVYDSSRDQHIISYRDLGNSSYGTSVVMTTSFVDLNSTIAIAKDAILDAATGVVITTGGVSSGHTGLTTNSVYYVGTDGAITATNAGINKKLGRAISATEILMGDLA